MNRSSPGRPAWICVSDPTPRARAHDPCPQWRGLKTPPPDLLNALRSLSLGRSRNPDPSCDLQSNLAPPRPMRVRTIEVLEIGKQHEFEILVIAAQYELPALGRAK